VFLGIDNQHYSVCLRYRHQVELVRFLNQFADPQMELSPGWDKKVDQNGRVSDSIANLVPRVTRLVDSVGA
jgi:hypothetical protein